MSTEFNNSLDMFDVSVKIKDDNDNDDTNDRTLSTVIKSQTENKINYNFIVNKDHNHIGTIILFHLPSIFKACNKKHKY